MRKRRKQSIFDFNHIDPHIQEEELEEIKNLFRFYHKRFWCLKRAHGRFKKMNLLINLTSSGLVAIGTIAGGVTMNPIVLGGWYIWSQQTEVFPGYRIVALTAVRATI